MPRETPFTTTRTKLALGAGMYSDAMFENRTSRMTESSPLALSRLRVRKPSIRRSLSNASIEIPNDFLTDMSKDVLPRYETPTSPSCSPSREMIAGTSMSVPWKATISSCQSGAAKSRKIVCKTSGSYKPVPVSLGTSLRSVRSIRSDFGSASGRVCSSWPPRIPGGPPRRPRAGRLAISFRARSRSARSSCPFSSASNCSCRSTS